MHRAAGRTCRNALERVTSDSFILLQPNVAFSRETGWRGLCSCTDRDRPDRRLQRLVGGCPQLILLTNTPPCICSRDQIMLRLICQPSNAAISDARQALAATCRLPSTHERWCCPDDEIESRDNVSRCVPSIAGCSVNRGIDELDHDSISCGCQSTLLHCFFLLQPNVAFSRGRACRPVLARYNSLDL